MTTSNHTKVLKQIKNKPGKYAKYLKNNVPKKRKFGKNTKPCRVTGSTHGVIHKYGIDMDRQTFKNNARKLGFKKYS